MLSRKEACSIFEEDIEPVWSTGVDCGRLEVRTPLQLKTGCTYRQTQKETRCTCRHEGTAGDRTQWVPGRPQRADGWQHASATQGTRRLTGTGGYAQTRGLMKQRS